MVMLGWLAAVHRGTTTHVSLGLVVGVAGLVLALIGIALTVRPVTHSQQTSATTSRSEPQSLLCGRSFLLGVLPSHWFPWVAVGVAIGVLGGWYLIVQRKPKRGRYAPPRLSPGEEMAYGPLLDLIKRCPNVWGSGGHKGEQ